jgi:hypothetical protein
MIKKGLAKHARRHARNVIPKQAQARLTETVEAFNNQVQNSLAVDAVEVTLYQVNRLVGRPCSCFQTNIPRGENSNMAPVIPQKDRFIDDIEMDMQDDDIFGLDMAEKIMNDDVILDVSGGRDNTGVLGVLEAEEFEDSVATGSVNCGICYRTLRQPGYTMYGQQRRLFTHLNIAQIDGYHIDSTSAPHSMDKEHPQGFVAFDILVPKFFASATYSIRNDLQLLKERLLRMDGVPILIADLRRHAGKTIRVKVISSRFTHVSVEFDMGIQKLLCNIGGENTTLDYDRLMTMSDIPIVLGPEVSAVNEGDIICIPDRGLYMKVRDVERKITADQRRLEWVCSTRVLQPTEPLRNISKGYKLR